MFLPSFLEQNIVYCFTMERSIDIGVNCQSALVDLKIELRKTFSSLFDLPNNAEKSMF